MVKANTEHKTSAINKGLMYLELQWDTMKYPFSSDCFGTKRHDLESPATLPDFPYGNVHDRFNTYVLLLLLEQHLPASFRNKLIVAVRPNEVAPLNFLADGCELIPNDQDTTSVGYHALLATNAITESELAPLSQTSFKNVNDDGVLQVYYVSKDSRRYNRLDAVCMVNQVRFAYAQRQESLVQRTEDYIFDWLNSGNYKSGTTYYPSAYTFLYFCSLLASTNYRTRIRFMNTLRREFNQIKREDLKYPLDYAKTVLTGAKLGFHDEILIGKLLDMQNEDGSWPADAMYSTNKPTTYFGSKSLSTMFSVLALMETIN